ncbi:putative spermidine/putrescine transport system permease protein [Erwinia toletana]|uniref:Spermidine/putrescine transport system permease protein n=1 Tax=Winslowiella toletana TaxID=92490 RepID=A0ABS4P6T5_9GAMM|nr:ABC transporter permease [Winslowiella toletana]MBP2168363.1 putative spermidine/putrescine transport system permease protein [Winslowiella toletana]
MSVSATRHTQRPRPGALFSRFVSRRRRQLPWMLMPALLFFAAFWLLPFATLIAMGSQPDNSSHINAYWTVLSRPQYLESLGITLLLSLLVSLAAVAISAVVACFLARHEFPAKSLLLAILTFPLAFPGVVVGFLVVMLAGRQGLLAQLGLALVGERWMFAYSLSGLFMGYLYFSIPRVIMVLVAACEKLDPTLEEAARSLGASQWRIICDVIVPGLAPALISSGALCFATSMGAFGTAFTLGTDLNVLPLTLYGEFTNYANFATAAALSVVMGGVAWLALILARKLAGESREGTR